MHMYKFNLKRMQLDRLSILHPSHMAGCFIFISFAEMVALVGFDWMLNCLSQQKMFE